MRMRFLRHLFITTLSLGLFFVLSTTAFAAINDYTVSGGVPASLPTVGDASIALSTIVITDVGGDDFTNDPESITVSINTTAYNNVAFDTTIANSALTISGSCTYDAANALTYASDGQAVTIPITDSVGNECGAGQVINILGLKVVSRFVQSAPAAASFVMVDNDTTSNGADVASSTTVALASVADAADATVEFGTNVVVGVAGNTTVAFTLGYPLANSDTVVFTMPAWTSTPNTAFEGESETFSGAGSFDCAAVSGTRVVTCTANGVISAGNGTIVLPSILATYASSGTNSITDFAINFVADSGGGADVGSDATVTTETTMVGALSSTNVEPASLVASASGVVTISFTTVTAIPAAGVIKITFPSGYNLTDFGTSQTPGSVSGITAANWSATRSGQVVTMTENNTGATTAGAKSFTLTNIMNPDGAGSTGTYTILTEIGAGADIETDAAITADTIVGNADAGSSADPDMPTGLSVTDAADGNGVTLTWTDPSDEDTTHIQILKGTDPLPVDGTVYATVEIGVETYTDTDVEDGDVVTYQIRSYAGGETSDLTAEVTLTVGSGETSTSTDDEDDTTDDTSDDTTDDSNDDTSDDDTSDDTTDDDSSDDSVTFSDVDSHWAAAAIEVAVTEGWVEGNPDGSFDPDGNLNRAQAAAMLWRVLGMGEASDAEEDPFTDVDMGEWYASYIAGLEGLDLVDGNPDGTYEPAEEMNRAEFLQLAVNVYLYLYEDMEDDAEALMDGEATDAYEDLDTAAWYEGAVTVATAWGFVQGSACEGGMCFNAGNTITRAEATQILYNMFADAM